MPLEIEAMTRHRLFVTRFRGVVSEAEFLEYYARVRCENGDFVSFDEIADMRELELLDVAPGVLRFEAERFGALLERLDKNVRCAVIAPKDLSFGLSRIYCAHADYVGREKVGVFRDPDEATEWIGVPLGSAWTALLRVLSRTAHFAGFGSKTRHSIAWCQFCGGESTNPEFSQPSQTQMLMDPIIV